MALLSMSDPANNLGARRLREPPVWGDILTEMPSIRTADLYGLFKRKIMGLQSRCMSPVYDTILNCYT